MHYCKHFASILSCEYDFVSRVQLWYKQIIGDWSIFEAIAYLKKKERNRKNVKPKGIWIGVEA